ncbi:MAG: DUF2721 domain-containing protein [Methylobacter sp.]|nr:DUF2721 domain-containing protein [Methylobacter sp.]MDP2097947.1 DUF2721 domain-containing protein [Methylobacter sp.]MDP2429183.1 DUF2721 domain-containing protein [Methylobacter sp.]MDP3053412.1 DUF2721 domain-containing protein [Methylobacter sp.]MDP3362331.1 DUF2721 domain-containing protein [Methylobacter sp.]
MLSRIDGIVELVTSSLVLFSSIGIFVLTLNARYTHAISRVRDIYDELGSCEDTRKMERELNAMVYRCHVLKWSFGLLLCSAISSGMFMLGSISSRFTDVINPEVLIAFVVGSVLFIFSSMVCLFIDVLASLKATMIHIERAR